MPTPREVLIERVRQAFEGSPFEAEDSMCGDGADAMLDALKDAGYVIVPKEPTGAMLDAAPEEGVTWNEDSRGYASAFYQSMVEAFEPQKSPPPAREGQRRLSFIQGG